MCWSWAGLLETLDATRHSAPSELRFVSWIMTLWKHQLKISVSKTANVSIWWRKKESKVLQLQYIMNTRMISLLSNGALFSIYNSGDPILHSSSCFPKQKAESFLPTSFSYWNSHDIPRDTISWNRKLFLRFMFLFSVRALLDTFDSSLPCSRI